MNKRGMVSPVFKYIMALIVGAMFLIFLIKFAFTYMEQSDTIDAYKLMYGFDDLLSAIGTSEDAYNDYHFGIMTKIEFDNDYLRIKEQKKKISKIIFSPKILEGQSIKIITKQWDFPFAVDNFFYITNPRHKYFLIYNDDNEDFVRELGDPEDVTSEIVESKKIGLSLLSEEQALAQAANLKSSLKNFETITFMLFEDNYNLVKKLEEINNAKARIVHLESEDYGKVEFEDGKEFAFLKMPMLIGAMFAEDSSAYENSVEKALDKFSELCMIYENKIELVASRQHECQSSYAPLQHNFDLYGRNIRSGLDIAGENLDDLRGIVENLESSNSMLGGDCPEIF